MFRKKAEYLASNIEIMKRLIAQHNLRGEAQLSKMFLGLAERDTKIQFIKQFKGMKDKYARNMMLDVYHPDFVNSVVAIDSRITGVLQNYKLPTLRDVKYDVLEALLISIANDIGLIAWELDRLMYNYEKEF